MQYRSMASSRGMPGTISLHSLTDRGPISMTRPKRPNSGLSFPRTSVFIAETEDPRTTRNERVPLRCRSMSICVEVMAVGELLTRSGNSSITTTMPLLSSMILDRTPKNDGMSRTSSVPWPASSITARNSSRLASSPLSVA